MKKLGLILMLMVIATITFSQVKKNGNKVTEGTYVFGKEFAVVHDKVNDYTFYAVDMTKFPSSFERTYFVELVYKNDKLVSVSSDISKDQLMFKAHNRYSVKEIFQELDKLKEKAIKEAAQVPETEKKKLQGKYKK